ncbi:MAG TPA: DeoR/GlpR family DNA-binding transcription regulator [Candidatus Olsenella excrementavium]|uniref:DeoR/GlpR family DNA-binding transcription regulator n=1 Tax=Candidatus Olsenella excrementavium TaxID=2838709 RepID=A0A9D1ZAD1_9ACTN|nr:DeoR/GlpR family DNA-binding transcription regulator [Candidatus Olsenella excrementavium]
MGMGKSRSFVEQRRDTITGILRARGRASVADLAEQLGISPLTVRRDLDYLEERGIATRRYGEAILAEEGTVAVRETDPTLAARTAIARTAAKLVRNHDLIFVNTSSTALEMVSHVEAEGVTVVTNSAKAQRLPIPPSGMILMTGGEVRPPRGVLSGEFALNNIRSVSATNCFLGCAGISTTAGITSTTQQEATVNSLMVERSDRMILLADSSKLGIGAGFTYAPLDRVTLLITDTGATDEDVEVLLEAGIHEIRRVEPLP